MSETDGLAAEAPPVELPVTLTAFAATLRASMLPPETPGGRPRIQIGDPDEVWIKWLRIKHRNDKRTPTEWRTLIDTYRDEPAHPTVLGT